MMSQSSIVLEWIRAEGVDEVGLCSGSAFPKAMGL